VVLVCCAQNTDYVLRCGLPAYPIDVAIAIAYMNLKAVEEGLGTCWIGSFYEDQVKEILQIPKEVRVVELVILGYPKESPKAKPRLKLEEIAMYDKWAEK
jgi:nitroreductase